MQKRSPIAVLVLGLVTLGFYSIYWDVKTKNEMNARGENIPTAWLIIVPIVNIWWMWKHSEAVGHVTNEKISGVVAFLLSYLLGFIGQAIIQDAFNKLPDAPVSAAPMAPAAPVAVAPTDSTPPAAPTVSM